MAQGRQENASHSWETQACQKVGAAEEGSVQNPGLPAAEPGSLPMSSFLLG